MANLGQIAGDDYLGERKASLQDLLTVKSVTMAGFVGGFWCPKLDVVEVPNDHIAVLLLQ